MPRWFLLATVVLGAACQREALPPHVTVEEIVADLAPPLATGAVVEQPAPGAVQVAVLRPEVDRPGVVPRQGLVAPPPTIVRLRVAVPPDAVLRFAIGVDGPKRYERDRSGVAFRVHVDGGERFRETINPAERTRHRGWHDGSVDLSGEQGRMVELALETLAEDPARPLAGTPGWSHVRLVRKTTRERQRASRETPNLLVLLVDTLRADRLGAYGVRPSPSPTLDHLAATGLVFEDSVSQSSWTLPSVASIFTGLHPRSHGVGALAAIDGDRMTSAGFLPDLLLTWAELAHAAGISTVGFSANPLVGRASNLSQGFESFDVLAWDPSTEDWHPAADVNHRFLGWLGQHREWRFVAYLQYMEPHDPYDPPAAFRPPAPPGLRPALARGRIAKLAKAIDSRGAAGLSAAEIDYVRQLYDGEIRTWDDALATLLRGLESAGVLDSTIVVVTADHGEEFQEHGRLRHGSQLYEESIRVPLIITGPGVPAGRRADMAQSIDLLPTIAGLLALTPPPGLPGRDLLATREGRDAVAETGMGIDPAGGLTDVIALRTPRWKLIRTPEIGAVEVYDLTRDPGERANHAAGPAASVLGEQLDRWAAAAPEAPRANGGDPTLRAKLRQLGYVE
jgi:arylsulfatase A-like enzyme